MKSFNTPKPTLSEEQVERLTRLEESHEPIDFSDAPELTPEQAALAFSPGLHRPIKLPVTIRLDADVVSWFKAHADGKPYQTEINRVLRQHVAEALKKSA